MPLLFSRILQAPRARRQALVLLLILLLTAVAAVLILRTGTPGAEHEEEHPAGENHQEHQDEPHAGETPGLIALPDAQLAAAGITLASAGPARIASSLQLPGEIRFDEDRTAHVVPRVAGVVDSVGVQLGQQVKKGQVLAVLSSTTLSELRSELLAASQRAALARTTAEREERLWRDRISAEQDYLQARQARQEADIAVANISQKLRALGAATSGAAGQLARYELRAPFDAMVVEKHLALGESVREDANVFTLSDLSHVWAEIAVPASQLGVVRVGEPVTVRATSFDQSARGSIAYVGSLLGEQTRTAVARVTLSNPQLAWRPGLFVTVELEQSAAEVAVSVPSESLQTADGRSLVFEKVEGGFMPRPVTPGRSGGGRTEIVQGLAAGTQLAGAGSFVVKAQQGKGSASHGH
ncbi:efflux RND transporter periplasmic adaptor subunit [Xylophilus rhododendri]|uniref:Efflux RND transporter periplasmic adaptor subunit n=1 Tax=Xylophilus rhododendri TaxID=2697032 RepID=A0A857IZ49_9BURK|nr:efflux RND transporter periplasmic adaptor subunit [Xylophilus rhododendri]QHI96864.1 efflux RND transporter periplasmic adaptor subunit [Xylophilus rhododendri]